MKQYGIVLSSLGLILAGCANQPFQATTTYACQSYTGAFSNIEVQRVEGDQEHIAIMFGGQLTQFTRAESASGEKYVADNDKYFVFWTQGNDAKLYAGANETGQCIFVK